MDLNVFEAANSSAVITHSMKIYTLAKCLKRAFCHDWTIYGGHAGFTSAENLQYRNINELGFSISRATSYRILDQEMDTY